MQHEVYVPFSTASVRSALTEPQRVISCIPEFSAKDSDASGAVLGRLRVRIGGSTITYRGTLTLAEHADGLTIEGEGVEARGNGSADLALSVTARPAEDGAGTMLVVCGTLRGEGRITEYDDRQIERAGRRLLDRFVAAFEESLVADGLEAAELPPAGTESAAELESGAKPELEPGAGPGAELEPGAAGREPGREVEPGPGPGPELKGRSEPALDSGAKPELESRPEPGLEPEPAPEPAPEPESGPQATPGSGPGPGPEAEPEHAPEPRSEAEPPLTGEPGPGPGPERGEPPVTSGIGGPDDNERVIPGIPAPDSPEDEFSELPELSELSDLPELPELPDSEQPEAEAIDAEGLAELDPDGLFEVELPAPSLDSFRYGGRDGEPAAEAAHARRTMIGRSAEEVDHAPPRGRYAPVPAPHAASAGTTLRWAAPAAAAVLVSAAVVGRLLWRRRRR